MERGGLENPSLALEQAILALKEKVASMTREIADKAAAGNAVYFEEEFGADLDRVKAFIGKIKDIEAAKGAGVSETELLERVADLDSEV